jgi:hypothetical protein
MTQETPDLEALAREYLDALRERDVERCLSFFADDATIRMPGKTYTGREALEKWHRNRFAVNLRVDRVDGVTVDGDRVTVDASISSDRLRAWDIRTVGGRGTIGFEDGKIKNVKLGLRLGNPFKRSGGGT